MFRVIFPRLIFRSKLAKLKVIKSVILEYMIRTLIDDTHFYRILTNVDRVDGSDNSGLARCVR